MKKKNLKKSKRTKKNDRFFKKTSNSFFLQKKKNIFLFNINEKGKTINLIYSIHFLKKSKKNLIL